MSVSTKIARNLSIKHLRAFVCIAKCRSFSRAADQLAMSQPALTLCIKQFESIVEVAMLQRTTRLVSLTQQGQDFLPKAERVLQDIDLAIISARTDALKQEKCVKVSMLPSVAVRIWPEAMRSYSEVQQDTDVRVYDDNAKGVFQQVLSGEVDFGVSNIWNPDPDLNYIPFVRDRVGLICRNTHPLARSSGPYKWDDLSDLEFVGMAADTGISRLMYSKNDFPESVFSPKFTVLTIAALAGIIENGEAVSALPALACPDYLNPSVVYKELKEPILYRDLYFVTHKKKPLSKATEILIAFLLQERNQICSKFPNKTVMATSFAG
ncbi:hypothetical protein WH96_18305 [Kiloniella spongiae]|uniref:HTH lysR-type domain-containing protein n=1 Tax=Kiloniella spongiae TaxID=1489064 RepID=A0A0H2M9Q8_9PROT|nr:LysR family transcriptional regulator [Kiloniella spongiae]KLN59269.1 hypothetical protein WH96_18305 [Kiloniella spongiae]